MNLEKLINNHEEMLSFIQKNRSSYFRVLKYNASVNEWLAGLCGDTIQEKLYVFCYKLDDVPYCQHCEKNKVHLKDRSFFRGFQQFCSRRCSAASPVRIAKFVKTCDAAFGGAPRANALIKKKYDETFANNYAKNCRSAIVAKSKRRQTCLERYGVDHVFKVQAVQEAAQKNAAKSMHSYRPFTSKKGNTYRIRGYEDRAIDILEETMEPGEFVADDFLTPRIVYRLNMTDRNYYPDIFIPKENRIIEVKSWYWLKKQPEKNLSIMEHASARGFKFEFWVFSGNRLTVINNMNELKGYLQ